MISNLYPPHFLGGYELLCEQVARALRRRGHEVAVLTSDHGTKPGREPATPEAPEVHRRLALTYPFAKPFRFDLLRQARAARQNGRAARKLLRVFRPDVVFAWSQLRVGLAAVQAAEAQQVPVAWAFNDANILGYRLRQPKRRPRSLARWVLSRFMMPSTTYRGMNFGTATIISHALKTQLVAGGLPVAGGLVMHQGIEVSRFPPRDNPGEMHSPLRVMYAGQLHEYKGVHTLLEAIRLLPPGEFRVTIAGTGPAEYQERLRKLADECGSPVEFLGRVDPAALPVVYRDHDTLVFPSIWPEPFGLSHLEAMASGLVVVSTTEGGQGEFLVDDHNALTFPKEDAAALASCLGRLVADPESALRIARAGRATVERDFTLARYVDGLEHMLQKIARAHR